MSIIILGSIFIGYYFAKLEKSTELLNSNLMEQVRIKVDSRITDSVKILQQFQAKDSVKDFIKDVYTNGKVDKIKYLKIRRDELDKCIEQDTILSVGMFFSKYDFVVDQSGVYSFNEYYNRYFSDSEYEVNRLKEEFLTQGYRSELIGIKSEEQGNLFVLSTSESSGLKSNHMSMMMVIKADTLFENFSSLLNGENVSFAILKSDGTPVFKTKYFSEEMGSRAKVEHWIASNVMGMKYVFDFGNDKKVDVKVFLLAFMLFILLGFAISSLLAMHAVRKLQKPIIKSQDDNLLLKEDLNKQIKAFRRQIITNMLFDVESGNKTEREFVEQFGLGLDGHKFLVIVMEEFENKSNSDENVKTLQENEWSVIRKLATQHIAAENISCQIVNITARDIYVLGYSEFFDLQNLLNNIEFECGFDIRIGVGTEVNSLRTIWKSYDEACIALKYSLFDLDKKIFFYYEINELESNYGFFYTKEKEMALIHNIKSGNSDSVNRLLDEIYQINFYERQLKSTIIKRLIANIVMTIYRLIDVLYGDKPEEYEKYGRICQNVLQNKNVEESFNLIREICSTLCSSYGEEHRDDFFDKDKVRKYIEENYMKPDLSLSMLADYLGINYHYLSKLFRNKMEKSFIEYLTDVRMNKAMELLKNGDKSVKQIAELVGFLDDKYFNRSFKKYFNVTPGACLKK